MDANEIINILENENLTLKFRKIENIPMGRSIRFSFSCPKEEKICLFKEQGFKIDSLGRVLTFAPTKNDWIKRKELILNCGVDIIKFGWVGKVEKATGLSKRIIENTVKYFDLKVFKRKPPHST